MSEKIEELAIRAISTFREADKAAHPFNDFGSVLGAQDEIEEIHSDLERALRAVYRKSTRLKRRIQLWNDGNREVSALSSNPQAIDSKANT